MFATQKELAALLKKVKNDVKKNAALEASDYMNVDSDLFEYVVMFNIITDTDKNCNDESTFTMYRMTEKKSKKQFIFTLTCNAKTSEYRAMTCANMRSASVNSFALKKCEFFEDYKTEKDSEYTM